MVRGPSYAIREIDIPMFLSRLLCVWTYAVVAIVVTVGGVIVVMIFIGGSFPPLSFESVVCPSDRDGQPRVSGSG